MASVFACDFEGEGTSPSSGDDLTTTNTGATTVETGGTFSAKFTDAFVQGGSLGGEFITTAGHADLRWASLSDPIIWLSGYIYYDSANPPSADCIIAESYDQASAQIGHMQLRTTGVLRIRDTTTQDWASTALATGWHRYGYKIDLTNDQHRLRIYSGANIHGTTPDQDSGDQALTLQSGSTSVGIYKVGIISTVSYTHRHDRILTDDTSEPAPLAVDSATYDLSATYVTDTTDIDEWVLDATGSTGTTSLTQTGGTTVGTITESPTGVFAFSNPAGSDQLKFDLDAGSDTIEVSIWRRNRPAVLTLVGGVLR